MLNRRRKTAVIHLLWNGSLGGAERAVYQLASFQKEQGEFDVAIGFCKAEGEFARRAASEGIGVVDFRLRTGHDIASIRRTRAALSEFAIHHFHAAEPILVAASLLCRDARRIYTHRGGVMEYRRRQAARYRLLGPALRRGFQSFTAAPQAARAAELLFGIPADQIVHTVNGVDPRQLEPWSDPHVSREALEIPQDAIVVGTAATLRTIKRVDWLIRALTELRDENVWLVVLGDGPDRKRLETLAGTLLSSGRYVFPGLVCGMGDWLAIFDIFVLPTGPAEGFGNAVVEAMACGLPVIVCADSPALVSHVEPGRTGLVCSGISGMTACLETLAGDQAMREQIGKAAREAVIAEYPMSRMASTFASLYIGAEDKNRAGMHIWPR